MHVHVVAMPGHKEFRIESTSGSESAHRRVFQKLIEGEVEAAKENSFGCTRLSPENYDFALLGVENVRGRTAYVLELKPKRKHKFLIEGKVWIDSSDFQVVRLEGRPAASLSLWAGRPMLIFEYEKVDAWWMLSRTSSLAQTFFLGRTELVIDHSRYELGNAASSRVAESGSAARAATGN
jgi:hypothetical protein